MLRAINIFIYNRGALDRSPPPQPQAISKCGSKHAPPRTCAYKHTVIKWFFYFFTLYILLCVLLCILNSHMWMYGASSWLIFFIMLMFWSRGVVMRTIWCYDAPIDRSMMMMTMWWVFFFYCNEYFENIIIAHKWTNVKCIKRSSSFLLFYRNVRYFKIIIIIITIIIIGILWLRNFFNIK